MRFHLSGVAALLATLILTGCNTLSPARVSEEPEAQNQEEKCYQEFSALKKLDPASYEKYREQMNAIDENFRIYKSNEALIDSNASEIMLTEVKKMLSLVCVRINSAVYSNMRTRAQSLNKL